MAHDRNCEALTILAKMSRTFNLLDGDEVRTVVEEMRRRDAGEWDTGGWVPMGERICGCGTRGILRVGGEGYRDLIEVWGENFGVLLRETLPGKTRQLEKMTGEEGKVIRKHLGIRRNRKRR